MQSDDFIEYEFTRRDSVFKQYDAFTSWILAAYNYHIYKTELLNNTM